MVKRRGSGSLLQACLPGSQASHALPAPAGRRMAHPEQARKHQPELLLQLRVWVLNLEPHVQRAARVLCRPHAGIAGAGGLAPALCLDEGLVRNLLAVVLLQAPCCACVLAPRVARCALPPAEAAPMHTTRLLPPPLHPAVAHTRRGRQEEEEQEDDDD